MKHYFSLLVCLVSIIGHAQGGDSLQRVPKKDESIALAPRPEILSGGFIDIAQNGQMNASARLFKLYIGEPGKFQLPLSVYTGVSANNFSANQYPNDLALTLINPGAGFFNMSFDGTRQLAGNKRRITSILLMYQAGLRGLSLFNQASFEKTIFFNFISGLGITLITGAWERSKLNNLGIFWLNIRALYSVSPARVFDRFFIVPAEHNLLGWSGGIGVEISQTLNVKVFSFHFLNNQTVPAFSQSHLQLSFNYSLR